jgi:hypothetical protein
MRQVSRKKARERGARARVVAAVHARDRWCQGRDRVPSVACGGPLDVHELIQRSLWPAGYLDESNCLLLCRAHHRWIDSNIALAHEVGLLRRSWER